MEKVRSENRVLCRLIDFSFVYHTVGSWNICEAILSTLHQAAKLLSTSNFIEVS